MNPEVFARLAAKAQAGDRKALSALLRITHTPVLFQCRKLLRNDQAAEDMTRGILAAVPKTLGTLKDPADFEKWICRVTASRCMLALEQQEPKTQVSEVSLPEPPATDLDEAQTAQLVQQLVDTLPREPRICLLLYSCTGLKLKGISQLTGFPESAVLEHLNTAQKTINQQLRGYHRRGVHFTPIPALSSLLRTAMYASQDLKAAAAMVNEILPKKEAPVRRRLPITKPMLIALIAAATLLLILVAAIIFLEGSMK